MCSHLACERARREKVRVCAYGEVFSVQVCNPAGGAGSPPCQVLSFCPFLKLNEHMPSFLCAQQQRKTETTNPETTRSVNNGEDALVRSEIS